jgi:hypothetical protein
MFIFGLEAEVYPPVKVKAEVKRLLVETVAALWDAGEKVQDRFDEYPELRKLYDDQFNVLLDTIERNKEMLLVDKITLDKDLKA